MPSLGQMYSAEWGRLSRDEAAQARKRRMERVRAWSRDITEWGVEMPISVLQRNTEVGPVTAPMAVDIPFDTSRVVSMVASVTATALNGSVPADRMGNLELRWFLQDSPGPGVPWWIVRDANDETQGSLTRDAHGARLDNTRRFILPMGPKAIIWLNPGVFHSPAATRVNWGRFDSEQGTRAEGVAVHLVARVIE